MGMLSLLCFVPLPRKAPRKREVSAKWVLRVGHKLAHGFTQADEEWNRYCDNKITTRTGRKRARLVYTKRVGKEAGNRYKQVAARPHVRGVPLACRPHVRGGVASYGGRQSVLSRHGARP